jgi:hypothetical protein
MKSSVTLLAIVALALPVAGFSSDNSEPSELNTGVGDIEYNGGAPVAGTTCYDNGDTDINTDSGNEMTNWIEADDFELTADCVITGAEADWFETGGTGHNGVIEWTIYNDAGGTPGGVVASGNGINIVTVLLGVNVWTWYNSSWDFDQQVPLSANTRYWLGLHFSDRCDQRDDVYWAYSSQQFFNFSQESQNGCGFPFVNTTSEDRAFSLNSMGPISVDPESFGTVKGHYKE